MFRKKNHPTFSYSNNSIQTTIIKKLCKSKNLSNDRVVMLKNPLQVTCEYLWSAKDRHSWCDLYVLVLLEKALQKLFPTRKTKKQGHIVVYEVLISNLWLWKINFQFFNFSYNTKTRLFVHILWIMYLI